MATSFCLGCAAMAWHIESMLAPQAKGKTQVHTAAIRRIRRAATCKASCNAGGFRALVLPEERPAMAGFHSHLRRCHSSGMLGGTYPHNAYLLCRAVTLPSRGQSRRGNHYIGIQLPVHVRTASIASWCRCADVTPSSAGALSKCITGKYSNFYVEVSRLIALSGFTTRIRIGITARISSTNCIRTSDWI